MHGVPERLGVSFSCGGFEMRAKPNGTAAGSNFEFTGYATVYDAPFDMWDQNGDPFTESVAQGACKRSLANPNLDVPFLIGHNDAGIPLARTKSGTMQLAEDTHGLHVHVPSMDGRREEVRALASAVERGDLSEMSLAFVCVRQAWDDQYERRTVLEMDLHRGDVCAVTHGANPATAGASMRAVEQLAYRKRPTITGSRVSTAPPERRSAPHDGRTTMAPRQRLSDRLTITPGTKRVISGDDFDQMRRDAAELEQRADRAERGEQELRARLTVGEPDVYGPGSTHSWFRDIAQVAVKQGDADGGPNAAAERLAAHRKYEHRRTDRRLRLLQAESELESALTRDPAQAALYLRWQAAGGQLFDKFDEMRDAGGMEQRAASRTLGAGGYFDPPGWLVDQFVHSPRAGAPFAQLWTRLPLPGGVQSINVPQFAAGSGAGTGVQTADGAAVTIRDPLDGTVKAVIRTLAASLDASVQLLEQTPAPFDATFGGDLAEDMATQLDGQLLLGNNTAGQLNGVIPGGTFSAANSLLLQSTNNASSQTWAYGGASIAASAHQMTAQLYAKLARARGLPPTAWVVNPDVWAIICGSADGQNRPLVNPGMAAKILHGVEIVEDQNLTSTFGGSTAPSIGISAGVTSPTAGNGTYAPMLLGRWEDLMYFIAEPRIRVLQEVLAGTLQIRFQITQYVASMPARIVWGGTNVTYSGTDQSGGVDNGAACAYGAFTQFETNGPLSPSGAGY
jgi:HK97 family phage prohead protease/HK97 family phage major capsid protein